MGKGKHKHKQLKHKHKGYRRMHCIGYDPQNPMGFRQFVAKPEFTTVQETVRFTPDAWRKLTFLCAFAHTEIGGFGITAEGDPYLVTEFRMVKQTANTAFVSFDDTAVADHIEDMLDKGIAPNRCARFWIHTHPGSSPHPSGVDEETFTRVFGACDQAVMFILAKGGQTYARLRKGTDQFLMNVVPPVNEEEEAWKKEHAALVSPHVERYVAPTYSYGSYGGYGGYQGKDFSVHRSYEHDVDDSSSWEGYGCGRGGRHNAFQTETTKAVNLALSKVSTRLREIWYKENISNAPYGLTYHNAQVLRYRGLLRTESDWLALSWMIPVLGKNGFADADEVFAKLSKAYIEENKLADNSQQQAGVAVLIHLDLYELLNTEKSEYGGPLHISGPEMKALRLMQRLEHLLLSVEEACLNTFPSIANLLEQDIIIPELDLSAGVAKPPLSNPVIRISAAFGAVAANLADLQIFVYIDSKAANETAPDVIRHTVPVDGD